MADPNECLKNAQKSDPKAQLCNSLGSDWNWICQTPTQETATYQFCHCQGQWAVPPGQTCPNGASTAQPVYYDKYKVCYCCCSCMAWGTKIATPDGDKEVQTFVVGDAVLAAGSDLKWRPYAVEWSDGVPPGQNYGKPMMTVYFQLDGKIGSLIVTSDQVFLLSNGLLSRTELLVPGKDQLVSATGVAVPIISIEGGYFYGGVHHIATSETVATSADGHLLNARGIVVGDWALQIADIESGKVGGAKFATMAEPVTLNTEAYVAKHKHLVGGIYTHAVKGTDWEHARPANFVPYSKVASEVPAEARRFFTKAQAEDIYNKLHPAPPQNTAGQDIVYNLFSTFQGFYPDVHFKLEWSELLPNAFSWFTLDVPFVTVNGGLVRIPGVGFNTLAVIIAHEIGHLYGGPPLTGNGKYSCEGQADYSALKAVLPRLFLEPARFLEVGPSGIEGVEALFNAINPENRKGIPGQTCDGISTECRSDCMWSPLTARGLPECAGGRKILDLELESAVAEPVGELTTVMVTFNQAVNRSSSTHPSYYTFTPAAEVTGAKSVAQQPDRVVLTTILDPQTTYTLTVTNVISADGVSFKDDSATIAVVWKSTT